MHAAIFKSASWNSSNLSQGLTRLHCVQGIRNVPTKLRIQVSRKRNDDEDAKVRTQSATSSRHVLLTWTDLH